MIKKLKSESGFTMVESILALAIVSIALVGLFIATVYARTQAVKNYHYRSALLLTAGVADSLKFFNKAYDGNPLFFPPEVDKEFVIDNRKGNKLVLRVKSPRRAPVVNEIGAGVGVFFRKIVVTGTWEEPGKLIGEDTESHSIILREDYFFREDSQ